MEITVGEVKEGLESITGVPGIVIFGRDRSLIPELYQAISRNYVDNKWQEAPPEKSVHQEVADAYRALAKVYNIITSDSLEELSEEETEWCIGESIESETSVGTIDPD
ncbi:MAG: hypothetical protein ABIG93_03100 [archaeon]|nr:hypothetical protein [Nanoarchaeota archaeon]